MAEEGSDAAYFAGQTPVGRHTIPPLVDGFDAVARVMARLTHSVGISLPSSASDQHLRADSSADGFGDELQCHRPGCQ